MNDVFRPMYGSGVSAAPGTTTARSSVGFNGSNVLVTNLGAVTCYVRVGNSSVVATTADYPVLPGTQIVLQKEINDSHVAYITASGSGSIHLMSGNGK